VGVLAAGQGELERRVDALQGLVETDHGDDAVEVLAQDVVDAIADRTQQEKAGGGDGRQQANGGGEGQEHALAEGHVGVRG
jgi:hypothetical protein